jgi:LPXTG-motif cell wall-anchored protein
VKPGLKIEGKVEPPKPAPEAKVEPPKPAPEAKAEPPKPAPAPTPTTVASAEPKPETKPAPEVPAPAPAPMVADAGPPQAFDPIRNPPPPPTPAPNAMPMLPVQPNAAPPASTPPPAVEKPKAEAPPTPPKRDGKPAATPTPAAKSASNGIASRLTNPIALAVAGLVLVAVAAFVLLRRRRALPNDLDVTAIAEERDVAPDADESATRAVVSDDESSFAGLFDDESSAPARESAPPVRMTPPTPEPAPTGASLDSLFDEDDAQAAPARPGAATMSTPTDLPMDRTMGSARGAAPARPAAAAPAAGGDVMRLVQELERRIGALESKLDQANEAREKLERQVAAQSEELRVQRAAIARTQRALRTMSRGDEEKATEPALREETQTKIRPGSV